jgi:toluene monooxygenase system protein D
MSVEAATAYRNNTVGPILRQGELANAVAEAAVIDNPGKRVTVDDKIAYVRVQTDDEMVIRRATIEEMLGRPFAMRDLEVDLSSFAGRIETHPDYVRFWFDKHL